MISTEMNFNVEMKFSAPQFEHTAYPVLLASNDFNKWWVASDRRDAVPQPYFESSSSKEASVYQYITDNCTRPPSTASGFTTTKKNDPPTPSELTEDNFASQPVYVMACVSWTTENINWHEQEDNQKMTMEDIAERCDAVGGVAGRPCASNPLADDLPGTVN